jgi:hypothetical protein
MDFCKRLGQPIVIRHIYSPEEVKDGTAKTCPACWRSAYDQPRDDCQVCFGIGFVSTQDSFDPTLYVSQDSTIVIGDPGTGIRAPQWGGFAESFLTWMVEPDVAEDWFKITDEGVLARIYDSRGLAPWYPKLHDNDRCVNVTVDRGNWNIVDEDDRFQLKMVEQVTIRGLGKPGRPAPEQSFLVNQSFQMNRIPTSHYSLYNVPIDV